MIHYCPICDQELKKSKYDNLSYQLFFDKHVELYIENNSSSCEFWNDEILLFKIDTIDNKKYISNLPEENVNFIELPLDFDIKSYYKIVQLFL